MFIRVAFRLPVTRNSHDARRALSHAQLEPTTDHDPQARRAAIIALLEARQYDMMAACSQGLIARFRPAPAPPSRRRFYSKNPHGHAINTHLRWNHGGWRPYHLIVSRSLHAIGPTTNPPPNYRHMFSQPHSKRSDQYPRIVRFVPSIPPKVLLIAR